MTRGAYLLHKKEKTLKQTQMPKKTPVVQAGYSPRTKLRKDIYATVQRAASMPHISKGASK